VDTKYHNEPTILAFLRSHLDDESAVQEAAQAIFIGNESLLSNLTFIIHYLIDNPATLHRLQEELDTAHDALHDHPVWMVSRSAQLPYLVSSACIT
jgi:hypothetical protein